MLCEKNTGVSSELCFSKCGSEPAASASPETFVKKMLIFNPHPRIKLNIHIESEALGMGSDPLCYYKPSR